MLIVGYLQTNCYILIKDNKCLVVDPGADLNKIKEVVGEMEVVGILVTHHHPDHVMALVPLRLWCKAPIYDIKKGEGIFSVNDFTFNIIETPGHSNDSVTFYFEDENVMFCGDFIFKKTIGRTDLLGSSVEKMKKSLQTIKKFPSNIRIYPGHGNDSTLEYEFEYNRFLTNL
ncbi:MAG: MBL fold metallo-hydrolase [Bacilli bacterium]|nr:MBL fold metallo-hydrolase [Bacilli bacterium]